MIIIYGALIWTRVTSPCEWAQRTTQDYKHTYTHQPRHRLNSQLIPYCAATIINRIYFTVHCIQNWFRGFM